jgi:hypothetical protein
MRDRNFNGVALWLGVTATPGPWRLLPAAIRPTEICGEQFIAALEFQRIETMPIKDH